MDSLTQALLGASLQGALLGRWQGRKALLYGAALATLPDFDVLIDYGDAVANMTQHRGFSHSLLVLGGVSLLLTWLIRRWRPHPGYSGRRLLACIALILFTHVLLDTFTSYGTQLFWPLATPPLAWSTIFIIDPLYSLPLLLAVLAALVGGRPRDLCQGTALALLLSSLYLGFTVAGKQMAERRVSAELARQGIAAEALFSAPTPFNSLLWRVVVLDGEHYHEALVGWLDDGPPQLHRLERGGALAAKLDGSPQHRRLMWFSGGFLRYDRLGDQLVVTDLRLGMTGFHPFRFALAEHDGDAWQPLPTSRRWPAERGDLERLHSLWRRIWSAQPEIPLPVWAGELRRLQTQTPRQSNSPQGL
ncbi:metal-dependent hydrolase [Pseudomonas stutzeri]|nr:metal-dependent hydrolase [Stutzerimonas stutzeri]